MAKYIFLYLITYNISYDYIVAVPMARRKLIKQKFNHSVLIAKEVAKLSNKTLLWNYLLKTADTPSQTSLNSNQRKKNLKGKFALNAKIKFDLKDKIILLIDDVLTTNSTLNECKSTLNTVNIKDTVSITFAKTYL